MSRRYVDNFQEAGSLPELAATAGRSLRHNLERTVAAALLLPFLAGLSAQAGSVATVGSGTNPYAVAVNPATNKAYVANRGSGNVTVIDGATGSTVTVADPNATEPNSVAVNPVTNRIYVANKGSNNVTLIDEASGALTTIAAGTGPYAVAVNPVTNMIYVSNAQSNNVTVIDGATNDTTTVGVGAGPGALALNPVTNKVYVVNQGGNSVTVIDGATHGTTTVPVGSAPLAVVVNPASNKIYVANSTSNNVTVIDGATNSTTTVPAGSGPQELAVNPVTDQIYVANSGSNNVTVINGASNGTTTVTALNARSPSSVAVNPLTNQVYVSNSKSDNVTIIDGATNSVGSVGAGNWPAALAVDPVTNKIYVANLEGANVTVIDGATNHMTTVSTGTNPNAVAVNPVTNQIYAANNESNNVTVIDGATDKITTLGTGTAPGAVAVNPTTNKIYVGNTGSNNVTVIDGSTNDTTTISDPNAIDPYALAVNPVTDQIYVANCGSNNVTVIDGATSNTTTVAAGNSPCAVAVNPATNRIYVANTKSDNVTVIDGASNSTLTVTVGANPNSVAVNPATNKIYVANFSSNSITVIDGATNNTTTVATGTSPHVVSVNPVTNTIYVANLGEDTVTVIDGATNNATTVTTGKSPLCLAVNTTTDKIYVGSTNSSNITVIDSTTNAMTEVTAFPYALAVNPVTNKIYVANASGGGVSVFREQPTQAIPLSVGIAPLAGNLAGVSNPTFSFTTSNGLTSAPADSVLYQIDTWEGEWTAAASQGGGAFSGTTSALQPGFHILYAFATDGEEGTSTNTSGQSSPLIGTIAAYGFLVAPPVADVSPLNLEFGTLPVTTTSPVQDLTLVNGGGTPLDFSLAFSGPNAGDFTELATDSCSALSGQLAPGASCTVGLTFAPQTVGGESATLTVTDNSNGVAESTQTVTLSGTGIPIRRVVSLSAPPTFPSQPVETTGPAQIVKLTNVGDVAISFSAPITISGPFAIVASGTTCSTSSPLAASDSCTVAVAFTPTAIGAASGNLVFTDNATAGTQSLTLSGLGTGAIVSLPAPPTFQPVPIGVTTGAQIVTVTNTGNANLVFTAIGVSGPFAIVASGTTCSTSSPLAASDSCTVAVAFTPAAVGAASGNLVFTDNATAGTQSLTLSGLGTGAIVSLSAPPTFQPVPIGVTTGAQIVTVTNTGNANLVFTAIGLSGPFNIAASGTTCSTSNPVVASGTCRVAVTFTATAAGGATGTLSFADNVIGSPQTLVFNATGQDFTLGVPSGSSSTQTVSPGAAASYTLAVTGIEGFGQLVSLACSSGLPSKASCQFSPSTVIPTAWGSKVTLTIQTTAPSIAAPRLRRPPPLCPISPGARNLVLLVVLLSGISWAVGTQRRPKAKRLRPALVAVALGLLLTLAMAACGGGGGGTSPSPTIQGTPTGTYTITVTGTYGSGSAPLTHSLTLSLTVN
jgi:YVTN family beta-propeller protein